MNRRYERDTVTYMQLALEEFKEDLRSFTTFESMNKEYEACIVRELGSHSKCRKADLEESDRYQEEPTETIEVALYSDGKEIHNISLECTHCNEVIIDNDALGVDIKEEQENENY